MKKIFLIINILIFYNSLNSQNLVPYLKNNGKYVYVNSQNLEKFNNDEYDDALLFKENYAFVKKGNYWGLINKKCESISMFNILLAKNGTAYVTERGMGFYNNKFNFEKSVFGIFGPDNNFNEKYTEVYDNKNKTIILSNKGEYLSSNYDDIKVVKAKFKNSDFFIFKNNNKKGIIDTNFLIIHNKFYDDIELIYNTDLFKIKEKNKYGILNDIGEESIKIKYDQIQFIDNGSFFKIQNNGKWGLANFYGEVYFQPKLDFIDDIGMFNDSTFIFTFLNKDTIGMMNNFGIKVFFRVIPGLSKSIIPKNDLIHKYLSYDRINDSTIYFTFNNYLNKKNQYNYYELSNTFKILKRNNESYYRSGSDLITESSNYNQLYLPNPNGDGVRFNQKYIKTENRKYYDDINLVEINNKRIGFIVRLDGKNRFMDSNANDYLINTEYRYIYPGYKDDKFIILRGVPNDYTAEDDYYIYNYILNDIILIKKSEYKLDGNNFAFNCLPFKSGDKYQFLDFNKNILIPESVDNYVLSSGGRFLILKNGNKFGIYDLFNIKNHLPIIYDDIRFDDKSNFILVSKSNKNYFINIENMNSYVDKFTENIAEKIIENSKHPIIGNPIKIGNIFVAQYNFPEEMNWVNAKKACESLGKDWRLPTKKELILMGKNEGKLEKFYNRQFWGTNKEEGYERWLFQIGDMSVADGQNTWSVRAVKTIKN
jgi:hypothetical protein